jgi:thiamine pyrophosphate-dependent acetolactate synthase large subunit-like protein
MTVMTPSEALIETLRSHGVSDVFGIVGPPESRATF